MQSQAHRLTYKKYNKKDPKFKVGDNIIKKLIKKCD